MPEYIEPIEGTELQDVLPFIDPDYMDTMQFDDETQPTPAECWSIN